MIIKQLSVFLENKPGRLTRLTGILSKCNVNISAMSIAETTDYGIVRMIVDQPETAIKSLKENDLSVQSTDVIGIVIPDQPGSLHQVIKELAEAGLSISYMYGYSNANKAHMIIKITDPLKAIEVLEKNKIELVEI